MQEQNPRKRHDGPCCDSCIDDVNDGFQEYDPDYCCCRSYPRTP